MTSNPQIADYKNLKTSDADLFFQDHFERFKSWLLWSTQGGLAITNLTTNEAVYDRFLDPEIAALISRKSLADCLNFINVGDGRVLCITDAFKVFELMEASNG